ncbi:MAG: recombinase family protein, partial [Anaerolineae bacterium]|nr:recombinase family protein [Anaerolineae bacterium]
MAREKYQHLIRQDCPLPAGSPVVIYCRDSGGEEQDKSVGQQVEAAEEYAARHGLRALCVYRDDARLSSNTEARDQLQEMLSFLRHERRTINDRYRRERLSFENPFGVIFWKSNRLGRDKIETSYIKADLRLRGITLIDLVTNANTGNAAVDGLIEAFQAWQDEAALDEMSKDIKRGLTRLVSMRDNDPEFLAHNPGWISTGSYLGIMPGGVPRGFKAERIQIGVYKRKSGAQANQARVVQRIIPDPETWDRCRLAWEMRRAGASHREIHEATRLYRNTEGYVTFFANPIYTGALEYGGVIYADFVPALISREWFDEEQERMRERSLRMRGHKAAAQLEPGRVGSPHLLSGLVFCGTVEGEEHLMHIESQPAARGRKRYTYLICSHARKKQCPAKRTSAKVVEDAVIDVLMAEVLTRENLRPIAQAISEALDVRAKDSAQRIETLKQALTDARQALGNMLDAIEKMGYSSEIHSRYQDREREVRRLEASLKQLQAENASQAREQLSDEKIDAWLKFLREALVTRTQPARDLLRQFVKKIVLSEDQGRLEYVFPMTQDERFGIQQVDLR